ncbi:hypothetical protein HGRIS_005524 [Hohenbuehelia grisea]|uniref:GPI transamidase component PIG-T n=1 Tax=Hohenbuehelia grisea TaxID=104357 RepID=A0ABR3JX33_9AGAR
MRHWLRVSLHLCISLTYVLCTEASNEHFHEKLSLRSLRDGKVASTFTFTTVLNGVEPRHPETLGSKDASQHYNVFPLALGQVLREYGVTELHLSMNAGKWNYEQWGYPDELSAGTGAELWVWMGEGGPLSIEQRWDGLRNALSGLFCASLATMDEQRTTSPSMTFIPEGALPIWNRPHLLRHASLPSEHVCTENLTPFLKLLPCKSFSGIASLLNPHRLFDSDWHGMGIHVLWHPDKGVEIRLAFQSVSDPLRVSRSKRRGMCLSLKPTQSSSTKSPQDWSFRSLFNRQIDRQCPVARTSTIEVALPVNEAYSLEPSPSTVELNVARFYMTNESVPLDINFRWPAEFTYPVNPPSQSLVPLSVQRTLRGSSQAHGQVSVHLRNHLDESVQAMYLETMPWLVLFYLHTLQIKLDDAPRDDLISNISYIPSILHSRPTTLQALITVPPKATIRLTMDVTKAFLRYTEHPPDAQRGWDLPPAVIVPLVNGTLRGPAQPSLGSRIYTPILLVDLATPDFSMPYNVIIFTCTVLAFLFGTIFNLLTRKFVIVRLTLNPGCTVHDL